MTYYIGTSGFQYRHWDDFYPKGVDKLSYLYSKVNVVEINSSFYRIPTEKTVRSFNSKIPRNCKIIFKAPRSVTHSRRLLLESSSLSVTPGFDLMESFLEVIAYIDRDKIGPVLIQIHDQQNCDLERLENILKFVNYHGFTTAFEARDKSWYNSEVYEILEKYNSSLVQHDWHSKRSPLVHTSNFTYLRRHGPREMYKGLYTNSQLHDIIDLTEGKTETTYVLFNNDLDVASVKNAIQLLKLTEEVLV